MQNPLSRPAECLNWKCLKPTLGLNLWIAHADFRFPPDPPQRRRRSEVRARVARKCPGCLSRIPTQHDNRSSLTKSASSISMVAFIVWHDCAKPLERQHHSQSSEVRENVFCRRHLSQLGFAARIERVFFPPAQRRWILSGKCVSTHHWHGGSESAAPWGQGVAISESPSQCVADGEALRSFHRAPIGPADRSPPFRACPIIW